MIKTVIFDVDDTLYSFHYANEKAVDKLAAYTFKHFGWDREEFLRIQKAAMADIKRYTGTSGGFRTRILRYQNMLEAAGLPIFPHSMIMSSIYKDTLLDIMIPEEGIESFLRFLKGQNIRIGIGSDATVLQQFMKLDKLGLLSYIDFMVTSEEAGVEKPDPLFFERCNEKSRCRPDEVMFIGDNPVKDYDGSENAGYNPVWYNPSVKKSETQRREIHHYDEAPDMLYTLNQYSETGE